MKSDTYTGSTVHTSTPIIFAYCRVSTLDQSSTIQEEAIKKAYPNDITFIHEKESGTSREGRQELEALLKYLRPNDKVVVWKLDRLARNLSDLLSIVELVESKSASLEILDQSIDTSTASGKAFLQMLGVFAEFETNLRKERQALGIAKAKAEDADKPMHLRKYKGKQRDSKQSERILQALSEGMSPTAIAKAGIASRAQVYRVRASKQLSSL